jgi:uncharacterized protein (TIGR03435 family)
MNGISLKNLLFRDAFNLVEYQYTALPWMEKEIYDVVAKVPPGATRDQFRVMLQNLLIERFKIELHHEQREMTSYDLVVAKGGLKMTSSKFDENAPPQPSAGSGGSLHMEWDADGFPVIPASYGPMTLGMGVKGQLVWVTNRASIQQLIDMLSRNLKVPIADQTGLKGNFACLLHFTNGGPAASGGGSAAVASDTPGAAALDLDVAPTVFTALPSQLGLRLEPHKRPIDVLVIDKAEKTPVDN